MNEPTFYKRTYVKTIHCECSIFGCGLWVSMTGDEYTTLREVYGYSGFEVYHRDCSSYYKDNITDRRRGRSLTIVGDDFLVYTNGGATENQWRKIKHQFAVEWMHRLDLLCLNMFEFWK